MSKHPCFVENFEKMFRAKFVNQWSRAQRVKKILESAVGGFVYFGFGGREISKNLGEV